MSTRGTCAAVLALLACRLLSCAEPRAAAPAAELSAPTGFTYHQHQIFVPVTINGQEAGLGLIDTGATACAVSTLLARRLSLPRGRESTVIGTAGSISATTVTLDSVGVGGAHARAVDATVYDLGAGATPTGEPLAIILGYTFLKHFAVELDYTHSRVRFGTESRQPGRSVAMRLDSGIPVVDLELNGSVLAPFRIDTGASLFDTRDAYLNITRSVCTTLESRGQDPKPVFTLSGSGVGGAVTLPVLRLGSASIGGRSIEAPYAIVQPAVGVFADPATPGFIANYTLARYGKVVVDYLNGSLVFPQEQEQEPEPEQEQMQSPHP